MIPGLPALLLAAAAAASPGRAPELEFSRPAEPDVWASFSRADLAHPRAAGFPLSAPVLLDDQAATYRVPASRLPELGAFMHERFGRCGGFFAHRERLDAAAGPAPRRAGGPYTLDQAAWAGPVAARVAEAPLRETISALSARRNRHYDSESGAEAARWLLARWAALGAKAGARAELITHPGWKQPSVSLTFPGSDLAAEHVVLGGHLDSINGWRGGEARAPGADDNASGIAVLTEAARALAEAGFKPRRTVRFIAYSAEEVGLRGSQDVVREYSRAGRAVAGVIQFDMTNFAGSGDKIFFLSDHVDQELTAFLGRLAEAYAGAPWGTTECGYGCSDHASWTRAGYPAAAAFESAFEGMNHAIHSERDTLESAGGTAAHSVPFARLAVGFAAELGKRSPAAR